MTNDATRANGEAMPALNRRTALALTGAGLTGIFASAAHARGDTVTVSPSPRMAARIADEKEKRRVYLAIWAEYNRVTDLPDCPPAPEWMVPPDLRFAAGRKTFYSSTNCDGHFADLIAAHYAYAEGLAPIGAALVQGHIAYIKRIEAVRDLGVATLQHMERAYEPIAILAKQLDTVGDAWIGAHRDLMLEPCRSADEVQAKVACLLESDNTDLLEERVEDILKSLLIGATS